MEPEFAEATYELEVVEGTAMGRSVGDPVTATDEDEDDTLSYYAERRRRGLVHASPAAVR